VGLHAVTLTERSEPRKVNEDLKYPRTVPIGNRVKVATIRGIPIYLSTSWFYVAALYSFLIYTNLTNSRWAPTPASALALTVFEGMLFFGGILLHEAAHAVAARGFGLPVMGITLVFWGGATETRANARGPFAEFIVSVVGPLTTLVLAGVFAAIGMSLQPGLTREIVYSLAGLNLVIGGVNLLPGFPLDGGRMLQAATWGVTHDRRTATKVAGYGAVVVGVAMIAAAVVSFTNDTGWWLFLGYLGFVMISTGRATPQRLAVRDLLSSGTAADAMRPMTDQIPATISLSDALDEWLRRYPDRIFPVVDAGRIVGTISMDSARKVGSRDPLRPVRDAMMPLSQTPVVAPADQLYDVLEVTASREGLVLDDGVLVGVIGPEDVDRWYRSRMQAGTRAEPAAVPPRPDL
jgi:Zn-dependent protease